MSTKWQRTRYSLGENGVAILLKMIKTRGKSRRKWPNPQRKQRRGEVVLSKKTRMKQWMILRNHNGRERRTKSKQSSQMNNKTRNPNHAKGVAKRLSIPKGLK
jgi:hypothetical protein